MLTAEKGGLEMSIQMSTWGKMVEKKTSICSDKLKESIPKSVKVQEFPKSGTYNEASHSKETTEDEFSKQISFWTR